MTVSPGGLLVLALYLAVILVPLWLLWRIASATERIAATLETRAMRLSGRADSAPQVQDN